MIIYELLFLYACDIDYIDFYIPPKCHRGPFDSWMTRGSVIQNFLFTMTICKQNVIKRPKKQFKEHLFP